MKDFAIIKKLIGESVTKEQLFAVDCYIHKKLGLFIPSMGECGYAQKYDHAHPSYMIIIYFSDTESKINQYPAKIYSPEVPHSDSEDLHYYCILIDKNYFEQQYRLYADNIPEFTPLNFKMCSDILKTLNTFAFEYSKSMKNMNITLEAQATIITHWIIRSILGETLDMRAVSADYSIARAQNYMEQHYAEKITSETLADLGYISVSSLNRKFKLETGKTPAQYLIELRIKKAKIMLRRKNIPLTDIALQCGFSSSAHFSTSFISHTSITPSEYRKKYID